MPQTLRKTFSFKSHASLKPFFQHHFQAPLSVEELLAELRQYLQMAKEDLLQPRQQCIDRILREALS